MKVRVASVCQGGKIHDSVNENREYVAKLLELALFNKPDIVCLPEAFTTVNVNRPIEEVAEELSGPTIEIIGKKLEPQNAMLFAQYLQGVMEKYGIPLS